MNEPGDFEDDNKGVIHSLKHVYRILLCARCWDSTVSEWVNQAQLLPPLDLLIHK